ncbi:hypothetical protein [Rhodospirillaceae bacterium SYSU D60014]|uniref:hypothetical protein n=1 Tax=Virgifigura deserti TaxID=2268457 RepID=UPI000E66E79E
MSGSRIFLKSYVGSSLFLGVLVSLTVCYLTFERSPRELCEFVSGLEPANFTHIIRICDVRLGALAGLFFTSFAVISGPLLGPLALALGGIALLRYLLRRRGGMTQTMPQDRETAPRFRTPPKQAPESRSERGWRMAKRCYFIVCGFVFAMGLTWSVAATYAALQHNPQGEFCDYSSFDGDGLSAWLGVDCNLQWHNLVLFPLFGGVIGAIPLILYFCVLAATRSWQWLVRMVRA